MVEEGGSALLDGLGQAFLSSVSGFTNVTIGANNVNSLSVNYNACRSPITFLNGLRPPTQPSQSNGGTRIAYSYFISDGSTYSVLTNLTISTTSAFATTQDQLGNPYQTIVSVSGSRSYTYLPIGYTTVSSITGLANVSTAGRAPAAQRFYPYALLSAAPGVYTMNTAPYLDSAGVSFIVSPAVFPDGQLGGTTTSVVSIFLHVDTTSSTAYLTESSASASNFPQPSLQRQLYAIM